MNSLYSQAETEYRRQIERALDRFLPSRTGDVLTESMRYSLLAGGKRLRPIMTLAWCRLCGQDQKVALPAAVAVEMVHTYSLIHDDLPCMDDDVLRRGYPSNHVVYGEWTALLAGSGLYNRAIEVLVDGGKHVGLSELQILDSVRILCSAAGTDGILTGQVLDMVNNGSTLVDADYLERVNEKKTASMLCAACLLGCIAAGADSVVTEASVQYGRLVGLAFQMRDDILDIQSTAADLGKTPGKDEREQKVTFARLWGIERTQKEIVRLSREADAVLSKFPDSGFLRWLTARLCERNR